MLGLESIKQLKVHKRQTAQSELRSAILALKEAIKQLDNSVKESKDYTDWRVTEECRLFRRVENKIISLVQLDELRQRISNMHTKDAQLKQATIELDCKVQKATEHKAKCLHTVRKLEKDIEKYELLIKEEMEQIIMVHKRQAEEILDEFSSNKKEMENHASH